MSLECRFIPPPRVDEEEPRVADRAESVDAEAARLVTRRCKDVDQRLGNRGLVSVPAGAPNRSDRLGIWTSAKHRTPSACDGNRLNRSSARHSRWPTRTPRSREPPAGRCAATDIHNPGSNPGVPGEAEWTERVGSIRAPSRPGRSVALASVRREGRRTRPWRHLAVSDEGRTPPMACR